MELTHSLGYSHSEFHLKHWIFVTSTSTIKPNLPVEGQRVCVTGFIDYSAFQITKGLSKLAARIFSTNRPIHSETIYFVRYHLRFVLNCIVRLVSVNKKRNRSFKIRTNVSEKNFFSVFSVYDGKFLGKVKIEWAEHSPKRFQKFRLFRW